MTLPIKATNYIQSILQIIGSEIANLKYHKPLISYNWYVANGDIKKEQSHSWDIIPQRYAYDFVQLDDGMKTNKSEGNELSDYYCYEQNIIAPADGIIVELVNKYLDTPRQATGQVSCNANDIRGNYIIIKHKNNEFSLIAHLLKDSFVVNKGMLLAKCANSENAREPHVHFQMQNTKSFYSSAGIPIRFSTINKDEKSNHRFITRGQIVSN